MAQQITIIGLGQVGASIGLSLGANKSGFFRVGHDKDYGVERKARMIGAVDKTDHNLPSSVTNAGIVILCVPLSEVRDTFGYIWRDLMEGALVLDTAPVKSEAAKWAKDILPRKCHYVGLVPAINPDYLFTTGSGVDAAKADLFRNGLFIVDAPHGTPGEAVDTAMEFVRLLGAAPLLADMLESDGLAASAHILPQLVSAALLNATVGQPGWREAQKLTGRAYAAVSSGIGDHDDSEALGMSVMHDRADVVRALNAVMNALLDLRDGIESGDEEGTAQFLKSAFQKREQWLNERLSANRLDAHYGRVETQSMGERLFGSLFSKRKSRE